jgi:hypothetical protein
MRYYSHGMKSQVSIIFTSSSSYYASHTLSLSHFPLQKFGLSVLTNANGENHVIIR